MTAPRPGSPWPRRILLAAAGIVLLVLVAGAALLIAGLALLQAAVVPSGPNPYPDLQTLRADPAARLNSMPGADELSREGDERRSTPEGYLSAFLGGIFGIQSTSDEVRAYYDAQLRTLGWLPDRYEVYLTSTDEAVFGWCRADRVYRLAIIEQSHFSPSLYKGRNYRSVFDATLSGRSPGVPCPYR